MLAMLAGTTTAIGQIKVEHSSGGGIFSDVTTNPAFVDFVGAGGSGDDLELITTSGTYRISTLNTTTQDIGVVTYNGGNAITILVSSSATGTNPANQLADGTRDWEGLVGSGATRVTLQASVSRDTTGPVTAGSIVRIDAGRNIGVDAGDDIVQDPLAGTPTLAAVRAITGTVYGDIYAESGDITLVSAAVDMLGDVRSETGKVGTVFADAGDIGAPTDIVSIFAGADVSAQSGTNRETIQLIAGDNVYADIVASETLAKEGRLRRLVSNEAADLSGGLTGTNVPGILAGSVQAYEAEWRSSVTGDAIPCINAGTASADIYFFHEPFTPISLDELTGTILISDSLDIVIDPSGTSDSMIHIREADGLQGQIIVNQADSTGDWETNGEVSFGSDPNSPDIEIKPSASGDEEAPFYTLLSDEVGGGAIGLAPFNFHQRTSAPPGGVARDCDPYQEELVVLTTSDPLDSVRINHYGPVYVDITEEEPYFKVEWRLLGHHPWQDRTSLFEVDFTQTADNEGDATRSVVITKASGNMTGFASAGQWRIRPLNGQLRCAFVDSNPPVQYDSNITGVDAGDDPMTDPVHDWYYFRVFFVSGEMMLLQNDEVTYADLTAWANDPFEANADGGVDSQDLYDLTEAME